MLLPALLILPCLLAARGAFPPRLVQIEVGILLPFNHSIEYNLNKTLPAIDIAIRKAERQFSYMRFIKNVNNSQLHGEDYATGPLNAIDMFIQRRAHVLLGPMEDFNLGSIVRYSTARYKVPVISPGGWAPGMDNKKEYGMLTRSMGTYSNMGPLFTSIMNVFKWPPRPIINVAMLVQRQPYHHQFTGDAVRDTLANKLGYKVWFQRSQNDFSTFDVEFELREVSKKARIVVLCADPDSVRKIMLKAYEMNFINGEYVFFNIDLFSSKNQSVRPWYRDDDPPEINAKAREAYRALMTVTLRKPDSVAYRDFSDKVKRRAEEEYNYTYGEQEVNSFVGAFHDSVMLYALALNDSLAAGGRIDNGSDITQKMWNRTFVGITGNVSIDSNGDRNADYSLLDMNKDTGEFEVVANYYGNAKQYVSVAGKRIDWVNENEQAPLDVPPCGFDHTGCPDHRPMNAGVVAAIIMATLIAVALIVGLIVYRRMKFQAQLEAMNWLIPWEELETQERRNRRRKQSKRKVYPKDMDAFDKELAQENHFLLNEGGKDFEEKPVKNNEKSGREEKGFRSTFVREFQNRLNSKRKDKHARKQAELDFLCCVSKPEFQSYQMCEVYEHRSMNGSLQSVTSKSASSLDTIAGIQLSMLQTTQMFTKTSFYKDQLVALKKINLRSRKIDINRDLLIEVKRIKDLNNDHIARFIGACIDPPNECIITEYCPKGSLQDVLENDQINLDWMFKFSLMQDICRGMMYLQNNLGPHGNLKSSNCLVDSRFVLKITDFALQSLRGPSEVSEEEEPYQFYRSKLWTAPELVRCSNPPMTIKADVYSFAIVCQEIVYRKGVFYLSDQELEPKRILERVKEGTRPYLRPTLDSDEGCSEDMVRIISNAWSEDPNERPDFAQIKIQMKKINKGGDSGNLLDNLLSRMEQYANNLEGLVAQRTEQYFEEKKKAEDLLYMMLPKSVAGQLIRGEPVTAEAFDKVTIYFSDICGFTSLSAESTPWQVINLLNDLYTLFDSIIENFDCYKVETIGDAYMVVSGLPQRNGHLHAREVARMALSFLGAIFKFKIRHRPGRQLKLRIGIHSGPVIAGVVGLKMPRYCLFGDTVNMASRMESNGEPLRIHMSQCTKDVLDTVGSFNVIQRGYVEMKGKGRQFTYWLVGENGQVVDRTVLDDRPPSDAAAADGPPPSYSTVTTTAAIAAAAPYAPELSPHPLGPETSSGPTPSAPALNNNADGDARKSTRPSGHPSVSAEPSVIVQTPLGPAMGPSSEAT